MAFRLVAAQVAKKSSFSRVGARAWFSTTPAVVADPKAPSIKDVTVQLTFVDPSGARRKVVGRVGKYRTKNDKKSG
jgi:hypothetical protein